MELKDIRDDFTSDVYNTLDFLPTNNEANRIIDSFDSVVDGVIVIPKGATNGDMMKAMFPSLKVEDNGSLIYLHYPSGVWIVIDKNWWNAPYKRKRGDEND